MLQSAGQSFTARLAPEHLGFAVEDLSELAGWMPLAIGRDFPLEVVNTCPADGARLHVLCTLLDDQTRVRLGTCAQCGHVTYIDRPRDSWLGSFYRETWDEAGRGMRASDTRRHEPKRAAPRLGVEREAVILAKSLSIDRARPVCEIGCGYGSCLKQLEQAGFQRLVGIEASDHRAATARQAFGFEVFTAPFETPETHAALERIGPFGLILTIHALEHTSHPDRVMASAAALQQPGDYLIVSVPNLMGEPTMNVVMFLPHLHSFTLLSLTALAARYGYEVVDSSLTTDWDLNVVFRLRSGTGPAPVSGETAADVVLGKIVRGLGLNPVSSGLRRLWWLKKADRGGQIAIAGDPLDAEAWRARKPVVKGDTVRSMVVTSLARRRTVVDESPLEIQFPAGLTLLCK